MKNYLIVLIMLSFACVYRQDVYKNSGMDHDKQPVFFSDKVDGIFNAEECKKYGLFQNIVDLESAVFFPTWYGGYAVEIQTPAKRSCTCVRDPKGLEILKAYIDYSGSILYIQNKKIKREFMADWGIIDFDVYGLPISKFELDQLGSNQQKYKDGCLYGCASGFLIGALPGLLVLAFPPQYEDDDWPPPSERGMEYIVCLFIPPILAIPGCLIGGPAYSNWYKNKTIEYIKQSRRLKKLD